MLDLETCAAVGRLPNISPNVWYEMSAVIEKVPEDRREAATGRLYARILAFHDGSRLDRLVFKSGEAVEVTDKGRSFIGEVVEDRAIVVRVRDKNDMEHIIMPTNIKLIAQ